MIRHLFRLMWNKRKQNSLLMFEMLISFLVIFAVFSLIIFFLLNYRKPLGFDYDNVWSVQFNNQQTFSTADSVDAYYESIKREVSSLKQVREASFCSSNIPFSNNSMQNGLTENNQHYEHINLYFVDPDYKKVLNLHVLEGRWFDQRDRVPERNHVVINRNFKDKLFGNGKAAGRYIGGPDNRMLVIGVVDGIKQKGDFYDAGLATFKMKDTIATSGWGVLLVKVTPDAGAAFEGKLYKTVAAGMKTANIEIEHLVNKRKDINYFALVPMVTMSIVACFLVINVALGLFGVLWYNISRRRGEIGLRRAVGASGRGVSAQLVSESMILTTFSLIVGSFFAIQFPLLHVFDLEAAVYLIALLLAILFIYLLVLFCSLYPGRQAASVYPAVALHED